MAIHAKWLLQYNNKTDPYSTAITSNTQPCLEATKNDYRTTKQNGDICCPVQSTLCKKYRTELVRMPQATVCQLARMPQPTASHVSSSRHLQCKNSSLLHRVHQTRQLELDAQRRALHASTQWPWPLIFWPQKLISSSLSQDARATEVWRKSMNVNRW